MPCSTHNINYNTMYKSHTVHNNTYPKGEISSSKDSFVFNQIVVFLIKFCAKNRLLRKAQNIRGNTFTLNDEKRIMKLKLLILIFTLFASESVYSQIESTQYNEFDITKAQNDSNLILEKNSIFVEIGGNAIIYSINYDRLIDVSTKFKISTRIGIHYTNKLPLQYYRTLCIPIEISGLYSIYGSKHFVEIGSGLSYLNSYDKITDHTEDIIILALRLGYRFQKPEGGIFVKIGFVPLYDWLVFNADPAVPHQTWFLSGGLGIGYTF